MKNLTKIIICLCIFAGIAVLSQDAYGRNADKMNDNITDSEKLSADGDGDKGVKKPDLPTVPDRGKGGAAEEKVVVGTKDYRYTADEDCGHSTDVRTMCEDGKWSDWNKNCPEPEPCVGAECCQSDQCWNGSVCEDNPDYGDSKKTTTENSFPQGFSYKSGNYNPVESWKKEGYSFKAYTPLKYQKAMCKCKVNEGWKCKNHAWYAGLAGKYTRAALTSGRPGGTPNPKLCGTLMNTDLKRKSGSSPKTEEPIDATLAAGYPGVDPISVCERTERNLLGREIRYGDKNDYVCNYYSADCNKGNGICHRVTISCVLQDYSSSWNDSGY